jgi:hypothetical protein
MKSFSEFITEAFDVDKFREKFSDVPGLKLKSYILDRGVIYNYMKFYADHYLFVPVMKQFAKDKGLSYSQFLSGTFYVEDKVKGYRIELSLENFDLFISVRIDKEKFKNSENSKLFALTKALVKTLEAYVKSLKKYSKLMNLIEASCRKHRVAFGDLRVVGYFHEGSLRDITLTPPKNYSGSVDNFFNENFYNDINKVIEPAAKKLGIREVVAAYSASGADSYDIKELGGLK